MPQVLRRIALVLYIFLFFTTFGLEKVPGSRFKVRIVRKTKVVRFDNIDEGTFQNIATAEAGRSGEASKARKSKKGKNYAVDETESERKKPRRRSKVAPASTARTLAWTYLNPCEVMSYGPTWNSRLGKVKKSDRIPNLASCRPFDRATTSSADDNAHQEGVQSFDPWFVVQEGDGASTSAAPLNDHVPLNESVLWEESENAGPAKKSALSRFLSKFKREKRTKVQRIRITNSS